MKGTTSGASNREQGNSWNPIELMGATEMKITTQIERAKLGLTNGIKHNTLAKFLGALVLGAAMVAVTLKNNHIHSHTFKHIHTHSHTLTYTHNNHT